MNRLLSWFIVLRIIAFALSSACASGADADSISFTMRFDNKYFHYFNRTNATGSFLVLRGTPKYEAVVVRKLPDDGSPIPLWKSAVWTPYDGIIRMNLGPEDGDYDVEFSLKGANSNAETRWVGTQVTLVRNPEVFITNPTNAIATQPYLQLQGYSPVELDSVSYDISNAETFVTKQGGQITGSHLDQSTGKYTTHSFQCYDIQLANGLNAIALHVTDQAGNIFTTNLNVTLNYSLAGKPAIQLLWPQNGMEICGHSFTLRGQTEDASAIVSASITDNSGNTTDIGGDVERTGKLWVENIPLHDGSNRLSLTVRNSAGLSSVTNISLSYSPFVLTMDPVKGDLWLPTVTVTGKESDATYPVWVNGVKAVVKINGDGTGDWIAQKVPVTEGGVASFEIHSYKPNEIQPDGHYGDGSLAPEKRIAGEKTAADLASINPSRLAGQPAIVVLMQPILIDIAESNSTFHFTWNTVSNRLYQLEYTTDLISSNWSNLGNPIAATNDSISTTDTVGSNTHRYYRVHLLP